MWVMKQYFILNFKSVPKTEQSLKIDFIDLKKEHIES